MDELIGRLVANVGHDRAAGEKAAGIILDFLAKEGPPGKVQSFLAKRSGSDALRQQAASEDAGGMGEVQSVTQQFIVYAREKVGEDEVGEFIAAIPGLAQFV